MLRSAWLQLQTCPIEAVTAQTESLFWSLVVTFRFLGQLQAEEEVRFGLLQIRISSFQLGLSGLTSAHRLPPPTFTTSMKLLCAPRFLLPMPGAATKRLKLPSLLKPVYLSDLVRHSRSSCKHFPVTNNPRHSSPPCLHALLSVLRCLPVLFASSPQTPVMVDVTFEFVIQTHNWKSNVISCPM